MFDSVTGTRSDLGFNAWRQSHGEAARDQFEVAGGDDFRGFDCGMEVHAGGAGGLIGRLGQTNAARQYFDGDCSSALFGMPCGIYYLIDRYLALVGDEAQQEYSNCDCQD